MYRLERIVLSNWGRLDPQDIEIDGAAAILGPTGAGKSTIVDALQVAITGASSRFYDLNKSTGGANRRTIRDYCLGADDHISTEGPARAGADALIGLCFRDRLTGRPVSFGLMFNATADDPRETLRARFVAPDYALALRDLVETRADGRRVVPLNQAVLDRLKEACKGLRVHASATAYVDHYLLAMRHRGAAPDARQVLRNFREAIAFQPIDDPTAFVRRHILEKDDIDVAALKSSIERYRWLEAEVRKREQQLKDISAVRGRFQTWAAHLIRLNVLRFTAAHAEARRLALVTERVEAKRADLAVRIGREESARQKSEQRIREHEDDILRKRAALADAPEALQLRMLDQERKTLEVQQRIAQESVRSRARALSKLAIVAQMRDQIPLRLHDGLAAATTFLSLVRGKNVETLAAYDTELAETERNMMVLLEAETSLVQQEEALEIEIATDRQALADLEQRLAAAGSGAALSRETNLFIAMLARDGIVATPLPDVVEVSDPGWAMALEMLLGANREALIVRRAQVGDAYRMLFRERRTLNRCRLVDTRKTAAWRSSLPPHSIADIAVTDNDDARVFVERQVGRFVRAESDADLERLDQAITKHGKTTAGMALRVYADLQPILGKTAQEQAARQAREEFARLSQKLRDALGTRDALRDALSSIRALKEQSPTALTEAVSTLAEIAAALRGNDAARAAVASPEAKALRDEIAWMQSEAEGWKAEIRSEIEPAIKGLRDEDLKLQVELARSADARAARQGEEQDAEHKEAVEPLADLIAMTLPSDTIATARTRVGVAATLTPGDRDPAARLADVAADAKREAEPLPRLADDAVRRGRHGYNDFAASHLGALPLQDPDDLAMFRWSRERERQLEDDELRHYRQQFEDARRKMENDLTEGLINRLADKFQKAVAQIDRLNRSLAGRTFTGQTYRFTRRISDSMKPIHVLADAVAKAPKRGLEIVHDADVDPQVRHGYRELQRRLDDDQLVLDLQDYRKFFDFDLAMTNDRAQETTLSKRAGTGSGGQKQAPYYVAVGAAMAAAYYPKSGGGEPDGLGLVVFDEAFNNLDAPNTKALLDFFAALHLQVIVAAPDKVRAMFLETVDTVVSVNRRPDTMEPIVTVTRPRERARAEMARANPVNHGVEAFRGPAQAAAE